VAALKMLKIQAIGVSAKDLGVVRCSGRVYFCVKAMRTGVGSPSGATGHCRDHRLQRRELDLGNAQYSHVRSVMSDVPTACEHIVSARNCTLGMLSLCQSDRRLTSI